MEEKYLPEDIPFSHLIGVWFKVPKIKNGLMRRVWLDGENGSAENESATKVLDRH